MQHGTDTTRFFRGRAMFLTERAEGTGTTISNTGGIEHAHRPIVFAASFLGRERSSLRTTQRPVDLRKKVLSSQASDSCCTRPRWGAESGSSRREGRGWQGFSLRGGETGGEASGWVATVGGVPGADSVPILRGSARP